MPMNDDELELLRQLALTLIERNVWHKEARDARERGWLTVPLDAEVKATSANTLAWRLLEKWQKQYESNVGNEARNANSEWISELVNV